MAAPATTTTDTSISRNAPILFTGITTSPAATASVNVSATPTTTTPTGAGDASSDDEDEESDDKAGNFSLGLGVEGNSDGSGSSSDGGSGGGMEDTTTEGAEARTTPADESPVVLEAAVAAEGVKTTEAAGDPVLIWLPNDDVARKAYADAKAAGLQMERDRFFDWRAEKNTAVNKNLSWDNVKNAQQGDREKSLIMANSTYPEYAAIQDRRRAAGEKAVQREYTKKELRERKQREKERDEEDKDKKAEEDKAERTEQRQR